MVLRDLALTSDCWLVDRNGLEAARHDVEAEGGKTIGVPTDVVEPQWYVRRPALTPDPNDCRRIGSAPWLGRVPNDKELARMESETRAVTQGLWQESESMPRGGIERWKIRNDRRESSGHGWF